jgi:hypothetical protein
MGVLWFATNYGVCSFNGKSFTRYTTENGLLNNVVVAIAEDKNGGLWFGTNKGISYFTGNANNGKSCFVNYTTSDGLGDNAIYDLQIAPVLKLTDKENISGHVIGTNQGFSALVGWKDKEGKSFTFEDIHLKENIHNYTPVWEIFNNKTGYPIKDLNTNSMCLTKKGFLSSSSENRVGQNVIWAGVGDNKIVRFDPLAIKRNLNPLNIDIKSVAVNDEKIPWSELYNAKQKKATADDSVAAINEEIITFGQILNDTAKKLMLNEYKNIEFSGTTKWYPVPENLVLPYEHNNVTIDFVAIQTDRNFLVRYQYILEGYDKDWGPITE